MPNTAPIPKSLCHSAVSLALAEDLGRAGDITSLSVIPENAPAKASIVSREAGVLAGLDLAIEAFLQNDPTANFTNAVSDGAHVSPGDTVLTIEAQARGLLAGERVALNFVSHLSGIASHTAAFVAAISGTNARITCTRKTTPGLRALEKYAVRTGGGFNHRFGLDDAILIKDNHIAIAGSVTAALKAAKENAGHMVTIEIEIDTLEQLDEALQEGTDVVLLDNMSLDLLNKAVAMVNGKATTEASGRVNLETVAEIARTGVDYISVGKITHSSPTMDFGLDMEIFS
ncbi:MAG: carboxylating nicotinate-nucleotide diphosphorylase [Pseudomonadota bacterium]|nr:carboxylating nicotinate-nucleotide diphosphorylase [Pseudomonadota bacterium]